MKRFLFRVLDFIQWETGLPLKWLVRLGYCPICGQKLYWFSGLEHIPEFRYCPDCNNTMYNEAGEVIGRLE